MSSDFDVHIVTKRLVLRRVEYQDFGGLFDIYSDPEAARYDFGVPWSAQQVQDMIQHQQDVFVGDAGPKLVLVVSSQIARNVMGVCVLTITDRINRQGEIGFVFHANHRGQGYATEAVEATLGFGFSRLDLHRIQASADTRNERSLRLLERVGMRREGHLRHLYFIHDQWVDDYVYAMLEDEWHGAQREVAR